MLRRTSRSTLTRWIETVDLEAEGEREETEEEAERRKKRKLIPFPFAFPETVSQVGSWFEGPPF